MDENYKQILEEKEIDLKDLCLQLLKKWKLMLVVAVIFAGAMMACNIWNSQKNNSVVQSKIETAGVQLSDEEFQDLETKLKIISVCENNIETYQTYLEKSIKCKLDPEGFYQGNANYVIELNNEEEILDVQIFCEENILTTEVYKCLADTLIEDEIAARFNEVVTVMTEVTALKNKEIVRIKINASYYTEDGCRKMLNVISDAVEKVNDQAFGDDLAIVEKISEKISFVSDISLVDNKQNIVNNIANGNTELTNAKNSLTKEQKKYLEWMKSSKEIDVIDEENLELEISINWKSVVVAAMVGVFCLMGFYSVKYLFGGYIHTKEELESYIRVPIIDIIQESDDKTSEVVATMITGHIDAQNINKIYLTSSLDEKQTNLIKNLEILLQKKGVNVQSGKSILKNTISLEQAISCGNIIFVEKCNETREKELKEELEKAMFCGVEVLGIVVEK